MDVDRKKSRCLLCSFHSWTDVPRVEYVLDKKTKKNYKLPLASTVDEGVACRRCGKFVCRECVLIMRAHLLKHKINNIPENFSSVPPICRSYVDVGHCCLISSQKKKRKHDLSGPSRGTTQATSLVPIPTTLPSTPLPPPVWSGALHLHQFDAVVGSTPSTDIDVFSYGRSKDYKPISHALFQIPTALSIRDVAPKKQLSNGTSVDILLPPTVASLPHPFNRRRYRMMVYTIRLSPDSDSLKNRGI